MLQLKLLPRLLLFHLFQAASGSALPGQQEILSPGSFGAVQGNTSDVGGGAAKSSILFVGDSINFRIISGVCGEDRQKWCETHDENEGNFYSCQKDDVHLTNSW